MTRHRRETHLHPPTDPLSGDLELEPDEHQSGGHYFGKQGTTRGKGKHTHEKSSWPSQGGSGAAHSYRDFKRKLVQREPRERSGSGRARAQQLPARRSTTAAARTQASAAASWRRHT